MARRDPQRIELLAIGSAIGQTGQVVGQRGVAQGVHCAPQFPRAPLDLVFAFVDDFVALQVDLAQAAPLGSAMRSSSRPRRAGSTPAASTPCRDVPSAANTGTPIAISFRSLQARLVNTPETYTARRADGKGGEQHGRSAVNRALRHGFSVAADHRCCRRRGRVP
ncbi:MAG: hypothetical protein KGI40_07635 [Xanthomonadaceae bacterium]|nr:hypothetical protein [Xanthomonadaceae bacterium]MDE1958940.1 hypothetical protein [Xanthomonadaceae bacterium]MDE2178238.1 hypothetical protein [Xanthomonadaceae bacterium]MDE2246660.1 hypothetical protein [Xanthomonadaceae bacterium]